MTTKDIVKPKWFNIKNYNKQLIPEEWLNEISKRVSLTYCSDIHLMTVEQLQEIFKAHILENKHENFTAKLKELLDEIPDELGRPINKLSIFEIIYLYHVIMFSDWASANQNDCVFLHKVVGKLKSHEKLDLEDKAIIEKYRVVPWDVSIEVDKKYPVINHLNGTPLTINGSFDRDSTFDDLRKILTERIAPRKKIRLLNDEILQEWARKQILAIFDLTFWFRISGVRLTNELLFGFIWGKYNGPLSKGTKKPGTKVSAKDFIKDAKEMSEKLISPGTIKLLANYCSNRRKIDKNREARQKLITIL